jgi:hypothetical protein
MGSATSLSAAASDHSDYIFRRASACWHRSTVAHASALEGEMSEAKSRSGLPYTYRFSSPAGIGQASRE